MKEKGAGKPDLIQFMTEIEYAINFKGENLRHGKWPAANKFSGAGFLFDGYGNFFSYPDMRRIDVFATLKSPICEPLVRIFKPFSSVDVIMIADFSLSMRFGFFMPKIWQIAKLAALFGYTSYRFGDRFGFIGCDGGVREDLFFPPTRSKTIGLEVGENIMDFHPTMSSAEGLCEAGAYLRSKKSLVIFVSDFYMETDFLEDVLLSMAPHQIIPVIIRHEEERSWKSNLFGFLFFGDMETGEKKPVFMSGKVAGRFNENVKRNETILKKIFKDFGFPPIILEPGKVDPEKILFGGGVD